METQQSDVTAIGSSQENIHNSLFEEDMEDIPASLLGEDIGGGTQYTVDVFVESTGGTHTSNWVNHGRNS